MSQNQRRSFAPTVAVAALIGLSTGAPAAADPLPWERELGSCVDAIYRHIDVGDAVKVRHIVSESERESRGYELTIDTIVYRDGSTQRFATVCLARGAMEPLRLKIDGKSV